MDIVPESNSLVSETKLNNTSFSIGKLLLDLGKIKLEDAERIIRVQKQDGLRFGDAALKLGLITEDDIKQVLSLQFNYPYLQSGHGSFSKELVAAYEPFSPQVEALRALRSQLILRWFGEGYKSVALVSTNQDDGCNTLAANLAIVFSQLGEQTLLIDANLRSPSQHKLFNLKETRGLSDILAGRANADVLTKIDSFVDLTVLGAGTIPPNPHELLSKSVFADFMDQVKARYDVVIVDTAPADLTSDAQTVASKCSGALLISRMNETKISHLTNIRDLLVMSGVSIVGAVVNDF